MLLGLDVAVDDPALVGGHQAARDLRHDRQRLAFIEPAATAEQAVEALAGHEFQDDIRDAVLLVVFEQVDHVGVVGRGHEPGLLAEPPQSHRVAGASPLRTLMATIVPSAGSSAR